MLRRSPSRGLVTLLFTDIVGSSEIAVELGDARWRELQSKHHAEVRRRLKRHGGREVDTAGDGFFATFQSPAGGVRCAAEIVTGVRQLGLEVRAGLHLGETELVGEKVSGIAVTTAARVAAIARAGQVLVTPTIVQMVAGSGLEFSDIGPRELKGVPGTWEVFDLVKVDSEPIGRPEEPEQARERRDRLTQPSLGRTKRLRVMFFAMTALLVVFTLVLITRDRGTTAAPPSPSSSDPETQLIVALRAVSGDVAFPIDINFSNNYFFHVGPIVFTGRSHTPSAFVWVPWGRPQDQLSLAQLHRTDGSVVDPGSSDLFRMRLSGRKQGITCVCIAAVDDRIWTPITAGPRTPISVAPGVVLRGIALGDQAQRETDIVVDTSLSPGSVASFVSDGRYLWIGDTASGAVYKVDPEGSARVKSFPLQQGADEMVFADGSLWVLDTLGGHLTRVDPRSGHSTPSFPVTGDLGGMAVGGGFVWVTDASGDQIWRIPEDLRSRSPAVAIHLGVIGDSPTSVAYDAGDILVGFGGGMVARINVANPDAPAKLWAKNVGNKAESIAVDHGVVWVAGGQTSL